jgi:integrase
MALASHVVRRGKLFWFRIRVRGDSIAILGQRELQRSLRTSNPVEARRRALLLEVIVQSLFEAARAPMLDMTLVKGLLRQFYDTALANDELKRIRRAPLDDGALPVLQATRKYQAKRLSEALAAANFRPAERTATAILADAGVDLAGDDLRLFCLYVLRVSREIQKRILERDHGNYGGKPQDELLAPGPTVSPTAAPSSMAALQPQAPTIREAYERFLAERRDLARKTRVDHEATCRLLEDLLGRNCKVTSLSRKDMVAFKDKLLKLPVNYTKLFKSMTAAEAIAANETKGLPTLATRTINNKYLTAARSFLAWAKDNELIETNPASKVKAAGARRRGALKDRDPFSIDELDRIFSAPLFQGCRSQHYVHEPGPVLIRDHRYWLPLLGLWTGARLNELAQLTPTDICAIGGVRCIDISDRGGKTLKTSASIRRIPLHPELERLGFLQLVRQAQAAGQARLFPELKPSADGYEASAFSKFFSRFLAKIGVKTTRNGFHSFRHTFADATRRARLPDSLRKRLLGHEDHSTTEGHYGQGYDERTLAMAVNSLSYEGVNFEPLYPDALDTAAA